MRVTECGLDLIRKYEGLSLSAYLCPAKVWTIGWGHVGPEATPGAVITRDRANELLRQDVSRFEAEVTELIGNAPTRQCQFDALVVLAYNIGSDIDADHIPEGLGDSSLLRCHKAGDYEGAARRFADWNKARVKGKLVVLRGLTRRREEEARLYRGMP